VFEPERLRSRHARQRRGARRQPQLFARRHDARSARRPHREPRPPLRAGDRSARDFEAEGCYVYEPLRAGFAPEFSPRIVRALDDAGLPVQTLESGFDLGAPPGFDVADMYRLERGTVLVDYEAEIAAFEGLPSSLALMYRGTPAALTFETARPRAWDERIAAHRIAVTTVLAAL
jgi:hypothetical protein